MRLNPTILAGFVINDGGMFAVIMEGLKANHHLLRAFTTYNGLNLPFVYPPHDFYLGLLIRNIWVVPHSYHALDTWVHFLFIHSGILYTGVATVKKQISGGSLNYVLCTDAACFLLVHRGWRTDSQPRSTFHATYACRPATALQRKPPLRYFWPGLFVGLTVMSRPVAAVYPLISAMFLWFMLSRNRTGFINSLFVALITLIVSAPWWAIVIHFHAIEPLLTAAATSQRLQVIGHLLLYYFTEESYATVIAALGLVGIAYCLFWRNYFLPGWPVVPFLVAGRSAESFAVIPLSMLAGICLGLLFRSVSALLAGDIQAGSDRSGFRFTNRMKYISLPNSVPEPFQLSKWI